MTKARMNNVICEEPHNEDKNKAEASVKESLGMNEESAEINAEIQKFLKSYDFMKLGQAINHSQWQAAAMIIGRMTRKAKELGLDTFDRQFTGIRQAVNRKNSQEAKQILSVVISKRVNMINSK